MMRGHSCSFRTNLEPSDVPYSPNQFLALDFFVISYSKTALGKTPTLFISNRNLILLFQKKMSLSTAAVVIYFVIFTVDVDLNPLFLLILMRYTYVDLIPAIWGY